jgi:hypothetical protein
MRRNAAHAAVGRKITEHGDARAMQAKGEVTQAYVDRVRLELNVVVRELIHTVADYEAIP